jgi:nitric oxide reductase subunit C
LFSDKKAGQSSSGRIAGFFLSPLRYNKSKNTRGDGIMVKRFTILSLLLMLAVGLSLLGCSGGGKSEETSTAGNAVERGKILVEAVMLGENKAPGCTTCHSLEAGKVIIGPSLAGIATHAETASAGMSAEEFLRESIIDPNAVIAEGFPAGVMYQNYAMNLSEEEINDIVAYLLTLK